jgi:hypothetical protein
MADGWDRIFFLLGGGADELFNEFKKGLRALLDGSADREAVQNFEKSADSLLNKLEQILMAAESFSFGEISRLDDLAELIAQNKIMEYLVFMHRGKSKRMQKEIRNKLKTILRMVNRAFTVRNYKQFFNGRVPLLGRLMAKDEATVKRIKSNTAFLSHMSSKSVKDFDKFVGLLKYLRHISPDASDDACRNVVSALDEFLGVILDELDVAVSLEKGAGAEEFDILKQLARLRKKPQFREIAGRITARFDAVLAQNKAKESRLRSSLLERTARLRKAVAAIMVGGASVFGQLKAGENLTIGQVQQTLIDERNCDVYALKNNTVILYNGTDSDVWLKECRKVLDKRGAVKAEPASSIKEFFTLGIYGRGDGDDAIFRVGVTNIAEAIKVKKINAGNTIVCEIKIPGIYMASSRIKETAEKVMFSVMERLLHNGFGKKAERIYYPNLLYNCDIEGMKAGASAVDYDMDGAAVRLINPACDSIPEYEKNVEGAVFFRQLKNWLDNEFKRAEEKVSGAHFEVAFLPVNNERISVSIAYCKNKGDMVMLEPVYVMVDDLSEGAVKKTARITGALINAEVHNFLSR